MTQAILDAADVVAQLGSDVDPDALQIQIEGALAAIEAVAGPVTEVREDRLGGSSVIILARRAASVRRIIEAYSTSSRELADDDWSLGSDRRSITRRVGGTNSASAFGDGWVTVYYQPEDAIAVRRIVAIQMIKHNVATTPGVLGFTEGNWSIQFPNGETWGATHAELLASLAQPWSFG